MRKIKVCKWMAKDPSGKDYEESTVLLLELMLRGQDPQKTPRGLDKFRIYAGLVKAFDKAKKSGFLEMDETQYKYLKDMMEKDVPAVWATNPDISEAVELFMDAKLIIDKGSKDGDNSKSN